VSEHAVRCSAVGAAQRAEGDLQLLVPALVCHCRTPDLDEDQGAVRASMEHWSIFGHRSGRHDEDSKALLRMASSTAVRARTSARYQCLKEDEVCDFASLGHFDPPTQLLARRPSRNQHLLAGQNFFVVKRGFVSQRWFLRPLLINGD
jgi:hypothetical protein